MSETFGHKVCDVPGYEHVWVKFRTSGYPRRLRREYDETKTDSEVLAIVLRYVSAWSVTDLGGQAVANSGEVACLDDVEDAVVAWLSRAFVGFWLRELTLPRPNSSPPSPAT